MRQLTMKFGTYRLAKWEKQNKTGIMNLFDVGDFELNKIADIIRLGNPETDDDEDAYKRLDDYLQADESNSLITAFFDLMDEFNRDTKLFKTAGVSVEQMKNQFLDKAKQRAERFANELPIETFDKEEATNARPMATEDERMFFKDEDDAPGIVL